MNRCQKLLCTGAGGTGVAAICCFTPVLVIAFTAAGLSWAVGYLDYGLLPLLAVFVAVTVFAAWRLMRDRATRGTGS